jgi:two-component system, LytTR family, sensor kinase
MEQRTRSSGVAPRAVLWTVLALVPLFALVESLEFESRNRLEGGGVPWLESFGRLLLPWGVLGACVPLVLMLVARFPLTERPRGRAIAVHVTAALLFPFLHSFLIAAMNLIGGSFAIGERMQWLFSYVYTTDVIVFVAIAGVCYALRFVHERHSLERESLQLRAELSEARLAALQGQLRPHFLFNTLNSVAILVRMGEKSAAVEVLARVSDLIRETLRERENDEVDLREEFALVREYLEIEQVRFGDRLSVRFDLDEHVGDFRVPFLLLQPLAENAIRHGVNERKGASTIVVTARAEVDAIRLSVEERGDGKTTAGRASGLGIGLRNTRERLSARFGETAKLELSVDDGGRGSSAVLTLPSAPRRLYLGRLV